MARWEIEQWHAAQVVKDMARNPFPLLVVGVLATLFFVPSLGDRKRQLTPNEYVDRAEFCQAGLTCDNAINDLQQAINLEPKLAQAYVLRASWTLKKNGSVQSALKDYQMARSLYQEQHQDFEAQEMTRRAISPLEQRQTITCLPTNPIKPFDCL
jgi:tetratricopeptide (TPR) repeat protein